jgi:hypothetical protein
MTYDELFEAVWSQLSADLDAKTLDAGLSLSEAAGFYRELAAECRDRAAGLEQEAEADGES